MKDTSVAALKGGIVSCLGGPGGDPDYHHVYAAAVMVKVLLDEGYQVDQDSINGIKKDNSSGTDFEKEVNDDNPYWLEKLKETK